MTWIIEQRNSQKIQHKDKINVKYVGKDKRYGEEVENSSTCLRGVVQRKKKTEEVNVIL